MQGVNCLGRYDCLGITRLVCCGTWSSWHGVHKSASRFAWYWLGALCRRWTHRLLFGSPLGLCAFLSEPKGCAVWVGARGIGTCCPFLMLSLLASSGTFPWHVPRGRGGRTGAAAVGVDYGGSPLQLLRFGRIACTSNTCFCITFSCPWWRRGGFFAVVCSCFVWLSVVVLSFRHATFPQRALSGASHGCTYRNVNT